jgi:hypothetical protein
MVVEPHPALAVPDEPVKTVQEPGIAGRAASIVASLCAVIATIIGLIVLGWFILFVTKGRFLKHSFESYAPHTCGQKRASLRASTDLPTTIKPIRLCPSPVRCRTISAAAARCSPLACRTIRHRLAVARRTRPVNAFTLCAAH